MTKITVKKSEFAKIVGTSAAYITKLEKKGIFINCIVNNELIKFDSIVAFIDNYDFTRDAQRDANSLKKDNKKIYVSKKELVSIFDFKSANELSRLDKKGIFKDCYDGIKLKRLDTLKTYIEYLDKLNIDNDKNINNSNNEDFIPKNVNEIREFYQDLVLSAKTPSQKANISKEEDIKIEKFLKNQELEKNLLPKEDVQKEAFEVARKLRDAFLSLPDRIALDCERKSKDKIHDIMINEINYILEELSQ